MLNDNLFLLIPNNSGSTFVYKSLCNSELVSYLPREGQFINGFIGTKPITRGYQFIWAGTDYINTIDDVTLHDWEHNKKAWKHRIINHNHDNIFIEKSPPNIAKAQMLIDNFSNVKFIISIRNPYATFESILRARANMPVSDAIIARHIINTMIIQRKNIMTIDPNSFIFFTYEELCSSPLIVAENISQFIPKLHDVSFLNNVNVKNRYNNSAYDYNEEQISRLSSTSANIFNRELDKLNNDDIMGFFGYTLL